MNSVLFKYLLLYTQTSKIEKLPLKDSKHQDQQKITS